MIHPRVSAILWPISHRSKYGRTRLMLVAAWTLAPLCSLPQVSCLSCCSCSSLSLRIKCPAH